MNENYTAVRLEDFIEINPKESLSKGQLAKKISMDKLQPFCRDIPEYEITEYTGGAKFRNGDTIMARITPCLENGKTAMVNIFNEGEIGFGSTEYIVFRAKEGLTDPDFVYYLICSSLVREPAIKSMVGSSGRQRVQTDVVKNLNISFPTLDEQIKISGILKSLDDKIAINDAINNNLEQQARALFKAWFVSFEPFGGCMPNEWTTGRIKDILKLKRQPIKAGEDTQLPYLPIDAIPMHTFAVTDFRPNEEAQSSLIKFNKDDIIIGAMRVYFHRVILAPCDGITRTTCFTLAPYNSDYLCFGLLCCDQDSSIDYANTTSKGSTMPYAVWDGGLADMEIVIPDIQTAKQFNDLVFPMMQKIQQSYFENKNLRDLRDSLLPKLMSGEIDISNIEI